MTLNRSVHLKRGFAVPLSAQPGSVDVSAEGHTEYCYVLQTERASLKHL